MAMFSELAAPFLKARRVVTHNVPFEYFILRPAAFRGEVVGHCKGYAIRAIAIG